MAAINTSTGQVLGWNPHANGVIYNLKIHNDKIYAIGESTSWNNSLIHGAVFSSNKIARFSLTGSGLVDNTFANNRESTSYFYDIDFDDSFVYVSCADENELPTKFLRRLELDTGEIDPFWRVQNVVSPTRGIKIIQGKLIVGAGINQQTFQIPSSIFYMLDSGDIKEHFFGPGTTDKKVSAIKRGKWVYCISESKFSLPDSGKFFQSFNFSEKKQKIYLKSLTNTVNNANVISLIGNKIIIAGDQIDKPAGSELTSEWGTFFDHGLSSGRRIIYHLIDLPLEEE
jgi:hypothetical protein